MYNQELKIENMEDVNGGAVVQSRGKYYAACDPSYDSRLYGKACRTYEAAAQQAEKNGWSKDLYTRLEYIKVMGRNTSIF